MDKSLTVEFLSVDHPQGNAKVLGPLDGLGLGVVAYHIGDFDFGIVGEIFGNALQVGAVARDEDGEAFHGEEFRSQKSEFLTSIVTVSFALKSNQR